MRSADREDRGAQVAADAPADDQVEGAQAAGVPGGGRGHVDDPHAAPLRRLGAGHDRFERLGERGPGAARDQQPVGLAGFYFDEQCPGHAPVLDPCSRRRLVGDGAGVERVAGQGAEALGGARGDGFGGCGHHEGDPARLGVVEGPDVGGDEGELERQYPEDQQEGPGADGVLDLGEETAGGTRGCGGGGLGHVSHARRSGGRAQQGWAERRAEPAGGPRNG